MSNAIGPSGTGRMPSLRTRGWELSPTEGRPLSESNLASLAEIIGEVRIVAFTEPWHLGAEPLIARNQLFQYLVAHHGFSVIALESGFPEGRVINDYVLGGEGDLDEVLARGLTWTFDTLPQNRELVCWMRDVNRGRSASEKLLFHGFDLPGSPGNLTCARFFDRPLLDLLASLQAAAPALASEFGPRLSPMIGGPDDPYDANRYLDLVLKRERETCTRALVDLRCALEREAQALQGALGFERYQWMLRVADNALALDGWLLGTPPSVLESAPRKLQSEEEMRWHRHVTWSAADTEAITVAVNLRDATQAENVAWIADVAAPGRKILLFAAAAHMSAAPVRWSGMAHDTWFHPAGTHLRARFGKDIVLIGSTAGAGLLGRSGHEIELHSPEPHTLDGAVGEGIESSYCIDLRQLPADERAVWDRELPLAHIPSFALNPVRAFDVLIHFHKQSPVSC